MFQMKTAKLMSHCTKKSILCLSFIAGVYILHKIHYFSTVAKVFFSLLVFSIKEGEQNGKIFTELLILFILSPLLHILLDFYTKEGWKWKKISFL